MGDELDFTAEQFSKMSNAQRVDLCRQLAERARAMAAHASVHSEDHLRLAEEWERLACEIKQQD